MNRSDTSQFQIKGWTGGGCQDSEVDAMIHVICFHEKLNSSHESFPSMTFEIKELAGPDLFL